MDTKARPWLDLHESVGNRSPEQTIGMIQIAVELLCHTRHSGVQRQGPGLAAALREQQDRRELFRFIRPDSDITTMQPLITLCCVPNGSRRELLH